MLHIANTVDMLLLEFSFNPKAHWCACLRINWQTCLNFSTANTTKVYIGTERISTMLQPDSTWSRWLPACGHDWDRDLSHDSVHCLAAVLHCCGKTAIQITSV